MPRWCQHPAVWRVQGNVFLDQDQRKMRRQELVRRVCTRVLYVTLAVPCCAALIYGVDNAGHPTERSPGHKPTAVQEGKAQPRRLEAAGQAGVRQGPQRPVIVLSLFLQGTWQHQPTWWATPLVPHAAKRWCCVIWARSRRNCCASGRRIWLHAQTTGSVRPRAGT